MRRMLPRQLVRQVRGTKPPVRRALLLEPTAGSHTGSRSISTCAPRYAKKSKKEGKVEVVDFAAMSSTPDKPTVLPDQTLEATPRKSRSSKASKADGKRVGEQPYESMTKEESDQFDEAVKNGVIPETELSKVVYRNWIRFPGCTVLIKVGSFYESYFQPALELSETLGIKLAHKRYASNGVSSIMPFCGFPTMQLDKYLRILVNELGRTVVVIEERETKTEKDLKERRVGRVVTPGTLLEGTYSAGGDIRYLLAISVGKTSSSVDDGRKDEPASTNLPISLAYTDASTGDFFCKESSVAHLEDELTRIAPREVVLDQALRDQWELGVGDPTGTDKGSAIEMLALIRVLGFHVSFGDPLRPAPREDERGIMRLEPSIQADLSSISLETQAISILRHHLEYTFRETSLLLTNPRRQMESAHMHIDAATLQALEIRHAIRFNPSDGHRASPLSQVGTLLSVLNKTVTNAGHRLLVRTLTSPSTIHSLITARQELVQAFVDRNDLRDELRFILRVSKDVARSLQRLRGYTGDPADLWDLATWIRMAEKIIGKIEFEVRVLKARLVESGKEPDKVQEETIRRLDQVVKGWAEISDIAGEIEGSMKEEWFTRGERYVESEETTDEDGEVIPQPTSRSEQRILREMKFKETVVADEDKRQEEVRRKEFAEQERMNYQESLFWLQPTASPRLHKAYIRLAELRKERDAMQEELRQRWGPEILLTWYHKAGYWISLQEVLSKETLKAEMLQAEDFEKPRGVGKSHVHYKPYAELGAERDRLIQTIEVAQVEEFARIRRLIREKEEILQQNSDLIDELDLTLGFAITAVDSSFVRPTMTTGTELQIINGRHPTVEAALNASIRPFTPNSTLMSPGTHLQVITGPNQGGKSTLLRQTAVIAILAQAGSFVPADSATIGIVDKVFSRVGARDDLFRDRSTFMLEMVETASILKYATDRSLVIMDEIGRGTTLQAGMSIAYATLEYILTKIKCRTLFATHYHELGGMLAGVEEPAKVDQSGVLRGEKMPKRKGVEFWCTDVNEIDGAFSYSYKLQPGINFNSHAIKAARIAGMPSSFLRTASTTLDKLQTKYAKAQEIISRMGKKSPPKAAAKSRRSRSTLPSTSHPDPPTPKATAKSPSALPLPEHEKTASNELRP